MKKQIKKLTLLVTLGLSATLSAQRPTTGNPVLPEFHADPEILYAEQTNQYYIYSDRKSVV